jgi:hypothetical protein
MAAAAHRSTMDKQRSDALQQMDLVKIARAYVQAMVDETPGYKALLLDKETMRIVSTLYGRTELAEHSVVHIERVDAAAGDSAAGKEHPELKVRALRAESMPSAVASTCRTASVASNRAEQGVARRQPVACAICRRPAVDSTRDHLAPGRPLRLRRSDISGFGTDGSTLLKSSHCRGARLRPLCPGGGVCAADAGKRYSSQAGAAAAAFPVVPPM